MPKTINDYFCKHLNSDKIVCEVESGKQAKFKEIYSNASQIMPTFSKVNQKIISIILPNSISYIEYLLAVIGTNNIFSPIPYFTSLQELGKVIEFINPYCIVSDREDIAAEYNEKYRIISPSSSPSSKEIFKKKRIDENQTAALYYSSGTTGDPKGVLYSHKNMVSLIDSINRGFRFTQEDNQLAFLPFGHTASINYNILPALMAGSNLFISQGFEHLRTNFFDVLAEHKITYTEIVPSVLMMLLKLDIDISRCNLNNLRFIGCGSSTLPLTSQKEFIEKYSIPVANLYGLSETGPTHIDYPLVSGWKPGSIGVPLDVNKCKISHDSEILIKGDNVFKGYYKNKRLYNQVVKDGWFHTGDIGLEKEDKFYFIDRKKDLIIKGGINVVPMEIEEILYKHKRVHECVVVGKEDKIFGEDIVAVVVQKTNGNEADTARDLRRLCKEHLSNYKIPAKILFWDELPKTHSKKPMRRKVREIVNNAMELDFLIDAVRRAGETAKKAFDTKKYTFLGDFKTEKITVKSRRELVVEEDIICQTIIVDAIKKYDENAAIYSEELNNIDSIQEDKSEIKYLIDPLDGTHNFCFGLPFWGISVAVLNAENNPIGAVAFLPMFDIMLKCEGAGHSTMISNNGVWCQTTTAKKQMSEALICYDNQFYKLNKRAFTIYERLTKECFTTRITGSATFDIALIACGQINARIWNNTNSYDIAGGILIVRGAGGSVSNFKGDDIGIFSKDIIMCSDQVLNQQLVEIIRGE